MKTNKFKTAFFTGTLALCCLLFAAIFFGKTTGVAHARNGALEIVGSDYLNASQNPNSVEYTATLINSEAFTSSDIQWFFNGSIISASFYEQGTTTSSSTVKISYTFYNQLADGEFATIVARIYSGGQIAYEAQKDVQIVRQESSVVISANMQQQAFNENQNYQPFIFSINSPVITTQEVTWFIEDVNAKFNPLAPQALTNSYTLNVTKPGTYTVVAKVDNTFSNIITVFVLFESPQGLFLTDKVIGTKNGFDVYELTLTGITENHNQEQIIWFRNGYSTPLQYGGQTFVFEPNAYTKYEIYATYGLTNIKSNQFVADIKIDRTMEIVTFTLSIFAFMATGLVIVIYRNVKKDRVW